MSEEWAPPVVAVVVSSDPGDGFEACLESLCSQDYPNLALLVVDDASAIDLTPRVAAVEPGAIVRRRSSRGGYSAGANQALQGVDGAAFFLFCHDDAVLDPGALSILVEESFRANAAVVGPKLVGVDNPELLRQVGLGVNRHGTAVARVHPGELDQSQHDEAREVFAVPGACTLVRADLFEALGGYDESIVAFGEDVDFCWRAQIAGARVAVAPKARVRHGEVAASGRRDFADPQGMSRRHELRAALKNYGRVHQLVVLVELLVLGLAESLLAFASGERERARRVVGAWRWNLGELRSLRAARRHLREIRQVPDRVVLSRMVRQGRLHRYLRPPGSLGTPALTCESGAEVPGGGSERAGAPAASPARPGDFERTWTWWARLRRGDVPAGQLTVAACLVLVALLGVRDLLFSRLPLLGDFVAMPRGSTMLSQFLGGIAGTGGSGSRAAPTAYGIVGLFGLVLGNSTATAWKVVDLASLAAGAIGVSRLVRPFGSSRARLVAAVAYIGLPLAWNSLSTGNVEAAVALGLFPYLLSRAARASGLPPFAREGAPPVGFGPRALAAEIVPLGLLLALLVSLAPPAILAVAAAVVPVLLACVLNARFRAASRVLAVFVAGAVVAACCCLPWSLEWFAHGASWSAFAGAVPGTPVSPAALLRGHTGPVGAWWGTWGIVLAAGYVLLVGRGERLFWASAWWLAAVGTVALAWAGSEGWLGAGGGSSAVLAAPAAAVLATTCGLGVVAFERDVVAHAAFGWRQGAAAVASACLLVGVVPAFGVALGGRAAMPSEGMAQTVSWALPSTRREFSVLWLGDPRTLPGDAWQLSPGLAWYTTDGLPGAAQVWPPRALGRARAAAARAVLAAERGQTADIGSLLAPLGVRYVVISLADAPSLPGTQQPPVVAAPPVRLLSVLQAQGDLVLRPVEPGAEVFLNADWHPRDGAGRSSPAASGGGRALGSWQEAGVVLGLLAWFLALAEGVLRRRRTDRRTTSPQVVSVPELVGS